MHSMTGTAVRPAPCAQPLLQRRSSTARARRVAAQPQALFGFLAPAKPAAGSNKTQELVSELIELTSRTNGGLNASSAKRQEIAELAEELQQYCPRNPLRSPLLFGEYEVVYASKPQATGGPYRSALGLAVFPGQRAVQTIEAPNVVVNELSYKALGFVPGSVRQQGEFTALDGNTFQLVFPEMDSKAKGDAPPRVVRIAYLDERIRVARSVPDPESGAEPTLFVFKRMVDEKADETVEDLDEQEVPKRKAFDFGTRKIKAAAQEQQGEAARAGNRLGTQLLGRRDGLATMAERRYQQSTGTVGRGTGSTATARKTREEVAADRAAARAAAEEERRAAREAAAQAKAAAEEERRARQAQLEAERTRAAELKEAARNQMMQLQAEAAEASDEAKSASAAAKEVEKAASSLLQQANQARGLIDNAASAASSVMQQLEGLKQSEKEAAAAVANARGTLKNLQAAGRRR
ncbi:putative plastid-lipid-associated protein 8 [Chlorella vulgaris]